MSSRASSSKRQRDTPPEDDQQVNEAAELIRLAVEKCRVEHGKVFASRVQDKIIQKLIGASEPQTDAEPDSKDRRTR